MCLQPVCLTPEAALGRMEPHILVAVVVPQLSLHSPLGDLTVSEEDAAIVALDWGWGRDQTPTSLLQECVDRLQAYFDGETVEFDNLPLAPAGSAYQQRVWAALRRIRRGTTLSYGQIALAVGGSPRSVGQANGANPVPILIPCHRVIAARGFGGYSGQGGLTAKRHLLDLEGATYGCDLRA